MRVGSEGSIVMPTVGEMERLIISDQQGNYYLITRDMLNKARVDGDEKRQVEQLVKGADVTGFSAPSPTIGFFSTPLTVHGACACSFAACNSLLK